MRDCEAIDVDLSAGEGIEVDRDRKMRNKHQERTLSEEYQSQESQNQ